MAENIPNVPSGAVPPKKDTGKDIPNIPSGAVPPKKETGKVQPKKETVRINLPPKPSAAPTIKMPALPPGGPTGASAAPAAPGAAAPSGAHSAPPATTRASIAAPVAPQRPGSVVAPKPAPSRVSAAPTVGAFDTILAIVAAVAGLAAVGSALYLMFGIPV